MLEMLLGTLVYLLSPEKEEPQSQGNYNNNFFDSDNGNVRYGINGRGEYKPISVSGERITYGINGRGEYCPIMIGNKRVIYGINGRGEYCPIRIE